MVLQRVGFGRELSEEGPVGCTLLHHPLAWAATTAHALLL